MQNLEENFSITKTTKQNPPHSGLVYMQIKEKILGKKYCLSLAFIGEEKTKSLNKIYRNKNKPTDILSFPLSANEGEIFINLKRTKVEAKKFARPFENFVLFLLIHGLCHLKGMRHGSKMETTERKYRKIFKV